MQFRVTRYALTTCIFLLGALSANAQRSSDGDADSVPDKEDLCPTMAGPASNHGCPVAAAPSPVTPKIDRPESPPASPKIASPMNAATVEALEEGKKLYDKAEKLSGKYSKEVHLLDRASDLGYLPANDRLRFYYSNGVYRSFAKDEGKAFEYTMRSAVAGDTSAMIFVAGAFLSNFGTPKSTAKAVEWYENAARTGSSTAMYKLGELYAMPNEPIRDPAKSMQWFTRAAVAGNPNASEKIFLERKDCEGLWQLSLRYSRGEIPTDDREKSIKICSEGSEIGCGQCSYEMFVYYDHRENRSDEAKRYLLKAKQQGIDVSPVLTERIEKEIAAENAKPYTGYINSNNKPQGTANTNSYTPQRAGQKYPYCHGAGQLKVEGEKSSYTDSYGHQYSTYSPLHWNACSHCNGTGYIAK